MKYRMSDMLRCPSCASLLRLYPFEEINKPANIVSGRINSPHCTMYCGLHGRLINDIGGGKEETKPDCNECYNKEIIEGIFKCHCGSVFPIIDSVPRFIYVNLGSYPEFKIKHRDNLVGVESFQGDEQAGSEDIYPEEYASIRSSFSIEWGSFDYDRDKAWGWDLIERKKSFLDDFGVGEAALKGKVFLDAGCGNGALTSGVSSFGVESVGFDISDSVIWADKQKDQFTNDSAFVHFIQGNLIEPPFAEGSFDFIYSYGVLHHTPNTRDTFLAISPLVRKNGRIFVWVYRKRGLAIRLFFLHGRLLGRVLSLRMLHGYCAFLSPVYKVLTDVLRAARIYQFRKRTMREITLDLFDAFSPRFNHIHNESEVSKWFEEAGFKSISISGVNKQGIGCRGDR